MDSGNGFAGQLRRNVKTVKIMNRARIVQRDPAVRTIFFYHSEQSQFESATHAMQISSSVPTSVPWTDIAKVVVKKLRRRLAGVFNSVREARCGALGRTPAARTIPCTQG